MSEARAAPRDGWQAIARGLCAFGAWYAAALILAVALFGLPDGNGDSAADLEHGLIAQGLAAAVVVAFAVLLPSGTAWWGRGRLGGALLWYAGFVALWIPCLVGYPLLLEAIGVEPQPQPHLAYFEAFRGDLGAWGALVSVCVLGPIVEEVVFRGYLHSGLRRLVGAGGAVFVGSVLFGLLHGLQYALPLMLVGLLLGLVREWAAGLLAPIVVHCAHNSWTVWLTIAYPDVVAGMQNR